MFERHKIRQLINTLEVNPNVDAKLGYYWCSDSDTHYTIHARECTPLTCKKLINLLWDLIKSSRSARGYKQIIWTIGFKQDVGPGHGPTVGEEERIGRFGFWFGGPGGDQTMFTASARLHYYSGQLGSVEVHVIRVSQQEFRAAVTYYSVYALASKPWTGSFWL